MSVAAPTILVKRRWTARDLLDSLRHPGRKPGTLGVPWVDELLQKRFGCVLVCQPCCWKYGDAFRRFQYRRDPEFLGLARCDFCRSENRKLWLYFPDEKFARLRSTQDARNAEFRRGATLVSGGLAVRSDTKGGIQQWKL